MENLDEPERSHPDETNKKKLKTAVEFTVGQICNEIEGPKKINFSKSTIAAIAELSYQQMQLFAGDLERFAKHAKRTTINEEDVKLLVRRNEKLEKRIETLGKKLSDEHAAQKGPKEDQPRKKK